MALSDFQYILDEERKRRKEAGLNPNTLAELNNSVIDTVKRSPLEAINDIPSQEIPFGRALGTAAKDTKTLIDKGASLISDSFNKVGSDIAAGYNNSNIDTDRKPNINLDRAADAMLYGDGEKQVGGNWDQLNQQTNQITAASPDGSTIGGMKSNLTPYDDQVRSSMAAINKKLASMPMEDVSPDQMERIQALRRQAGYMRGGTDRQRVGPDGLPMRDQTVGTNLQRLGNGLDVTFDSSVPQANRQAFVANSSGQMSPEESSRRNLARQQWLGRQGYQKVTPESKWDRLLASNMSPGRKIEALKAMEAGQNEQTNNKLQAEKNRLFELDINSQSKLRDIQGQVAQNPPGQKERSKWSLKKIGDAVTGNEQDILFNEDGRSLPINKPPIKGQGVIGALYQSPRGPVIYKGLNSSGDPIYVPFEG